MQVRTKFGGTPRSGSRPRRRRAGPRADWPRQGSCANSSAGGNGMCRKKPIALRPVAARRSSAGTQLQLVVVHPEQRARWCDLEGALREALVHVRVVAPPAPVDHDPVGQPVEERPERPVREAVVVVLDLRLAQGDRHEAAGEVGQRVGKLAAAAVPAHPRGRARLERRAQRGDEPAVGRAPALAGLHDRQAVGERDERRRRIADRPVASLAPAYRPAVGARVEG